MSSRFTFLRSLLLGFGLLLLAGMEAQRATGQPAPLSTVSDRVQSRSRSGQFVVTALAAEPPRTRQILNLETNRDYVRLDPTLLPVSCERIKDGVYSKLGVAAAWKGTIFVTLYPARSIEDNVTITPVDFQDGWRYRVELPSLVNRWDFVRAMVHVILLEMANRGALEHSAEIPPWLTEGLAQHLMLSKESEIILRQPGNTGQGLRLVTANVETRTRTPLELAHRILQANPPLTFQQLSWPQTEQVEGDQAPLYRSSAQLFVSDLLEMDDGRAAIQAMLSSLPDYYNWQFAFMRAFRAHFQRPLDVEKWWALHFEHFTGRDLSQTWAGDQSGQKLEAALHSPVQVRVGANDMPMHMDVSLQTVIREWDKPRQSIVLEQKLRELEALQLRLATNYVELTSLYRQVLAVYLQNRDHHALPFRKKATQRHAAEAAIHDLDELDSRRLDLR